MNACTVCDVRAARVSDGTVRPTGRCSFCLITEELVRMEMKGAL